MKCLVGFKFLLLSANCSRKVLNDASCVCCCHIKYMTQSKKLKWKKGRADKVWDAFFLLYTQANLSRRSSLPFNTTASAY